MNVHSIYVIATSHSRRRWHRYPVKVEDVDLCYVARPASVTSWTGRAVQLSAADVRVASTMVGNIRTEHLRGVRAGL